MRFRGRRYGWAAEGLGAGGVAPFPWRLRRALVRCRKREDGVSAVEFGLFAPVLFIALLTAVDLGLALYERMTIDHVLRAGAQSAMRDQGPDQVKKVLESTATKNFVVASSTAFDNVDGIIAPDCTADGAGDSLVLCTVRNYACPENTEVSVERGTTCAGSKPTFVYYRLEGAKTYDGMFIPSIDMDAKVQVQVR